MRYGCIVYGLYGHERSYPHKKIFVKNNKKGDHVRRALSARNRHGSTQLLMGLFTSAPVLPESGYRVRRFENTGPRDLVVAIRNRPPRRQSSFGRATLSVSFLAGLLRGRPPAGRVSERAALRVLPRWNWRSRVFRHAIRRDAHRARVEQPF